MSLLEKTLFGLEDKVKIAIEFLRDIEPAEGFYVADSGGKDSCVILKLIEFAGVKYDAHHHLTTIDPPELVYFVKQYHLNTIVEIPEKPFVVRMIEKGVFPTRRMRWCCEEYKEKGGKGRLIVTGIRASESVKRSKRGILETCYKDTSKRYVNPILSWSEDDVWEFIEKYNVPYCKLYNNGWKRIGCLMCPLAAKENRIREAEAYPRYRAMFKRAFEKMHKQRIEQGKEYFKRWKDGKEMFEWWLEDGTGPENHEQKRFFFED